jgi:TRAP transporter TAXI family solute receptor
MKRKISLCCFILVLVAGLIVCGNSGNAPASSTSTRVPQEVRLRVGTSESAGVYGIVGISMAQALVKHNSWVVFNTETTAGSGQNANLLGSGDLDIGFMNASIALPASEGGTKQFPKAIPMKTLFSFNEAQIHMLARKGSGITTLRSTLGKRVSIAEPGSGSDVTMNEFFAAWGWNPEKDFIRLRIPLAEGLEAIADGRADAVFFQTQAPNSAIMEALATKQNVDFISFDEDLLIAAANTSKALSVGEIPAGIYNNPRPVPTTVQTNVLVCRPDLDEEVVYTFVKILLNNIDDWKNGHSSTKLWTVQKAVQGSPIEFHPGAIRYFKEAGVWPPQ